MEGDKLILDGCNASSSARRHLLALAQHASYPVAVFFDFPPSTCTYRAQSRPSHPSLPPGPRVDAAIKQFSKQLEAPTLAEGFERVVVCKSEDAARELVRQLSGEMKLLKFPRTLHLLDLGAATDDDLVKPSTSDTPITLFPSLRPGHSILVTEKIDGANLAFSLSSSRQVLVQNRSHYLSVSASLSSGQNVEHVQFRLLGRWMEERGEELQRLLGDDEGFPERWVLYGEWMAATHRCASDSLRLSEQERSTLMFFLPPASLRPRRNSVKYTALPSLFLAFDIYDRSTSSFRPRALFAARLAAFAPSISLVPVLYTGSTLTRKDVLGMIEGRSEMMSAETEEREARREGVYVKVEDGERVVERCV